ncbi:hypothetical protein [Desulfoplanes formicivorans]|nr:hypothetical protein [Desulfoplanes formicivorans]
MSRLQTTDHGIGTCLLGILVFWLIFMLEWVLLDLLIRLIVSGKAGI